MVALARWHHRRLTYDLLPIANDLAVLIVSDGRMVPIALGGRLLPETPSARTAWAERALQTSAKIGNGA